MSDSSYNGWSEESANKGNKGSTAVLWAALDRHATEMKADLKELKAELALLTSLSTQQSAHVMQNGPTRELPPHPHHTHVEHHSAHTQAESLQAESFQKFFNTAFQSLNNSLNQQLNSLRQHMVQLSDTQNVQLGDLLKKAASTEDLLNKAAPRVSHAEDIGPTAEPITTRGRMEESVEVPQLPVPEERSAAEVSEMRKQAAAPVIHDGPPIAQEEGRPISKLIHHSSSLGDLSGLWMKQAYTVVKEEKHIPLMILTVIGLDKYALKESPKNILVDIVSSSAFQAFIALAILTNTFFMAYIDDQSVILLLKEPPEDFPAWWVEVDLVFSIFFAIELLVRLIGYRSWFFVTPATWTWNYLDVALVVISFTSGGDVNVFFFRMLRLLRLTRIGRLVKVASWLKELRKLLVQVFFGVIPLFWVTTFIALTVFFFSLLILRGLTPELQQRNKNDIAHIGYIEDHLNGIIPCFTTLATIVAGPEWVPVHEVLSGIGGIYLFVIPLFVVFVQIGVMNIVIGYFAEEASARLDGDVRVQEEIDDAEQFVRNMFNLVHQFAPKDEEDGHFDYNDFKPFFYSQEVQAFLSSHGLDTDSAATIYELCDSNHDGYLQIRELVLGMLKLKGGATMLNAHIILREIGELRQDLEILKGKAMSGDSGTTRV